MLFKSDTEGYATELQKFIKIAKATSYDVFLPYINRVEREFIRPLIGKELYTRLNNWYNLDPFVEDVDLSELITLIQEPIANLSYLYAFNTLQVKTSDKGVTRIETDNEKSLYQYQANDLKKDLKEAGFKALDFLMEFLEEDQLLTIPKFPEWTSYQPSKQFFINNTKEFDELFPINKSSLVFNKLVYYMKSVENFKIAPLISIAFFEELKLQIKTNSLTPDNLIIVNYIKNAIANFTISLSATSLGFDITDKGILYEYITGNSNNYKTETADMPRLANLIDTTYKAGASYLESATEYMVLNPDKYLTYRDNIISKNYTKGFNNTNKKVIKF